MFATATAPSDPRRFERSGALGLFSSPTRCPKPNPPRESRRSDEPGGGQGSSSPARRRSSVPPAPGRGFRLGSFCPTPSANRDPRLGPSCLTLLDRPPENFLGGSGPPALGPFCLGLDRQPEPPGLGPFCPGPSRRLGPPALGLFGAAPGPGITGQALAREPSRIRLTGRHPCSDDTLLPPPDRSRARRFAATRRAAPRWYPIFPRSR